MDSIGKGLSVQYVQQVHNSSLALTRKVMHRFHLLFHLKRFSKTIIDVVHNKKEESPSIGKGITIPRLEVWSWMDGSSQLTCQILKAKQ